MDIGRAIEITRKDGLVARPGWNGKGMFVGLNDAQGDYQEYLVMFTADGTYVPWLASQTDILATDWIDVTVEHVLTEDLSPKYLEETV